LHRQGLGMAQDWKEAGRHYLLSAELGNERAQYNLGMMHLDGDGFPRDYVKAYMWFNIAYANGHAEAETFKNIVAQKLSPRDLTRAQSLSAECIRKNYKNC